MKENIKTIIEWQEQAFPDATFNGQRDKFEDEIEEFINAKIKLEKLMELADCFIVACGIARFDSVVAMIYFAKIDSIRAMHEISPASLATAIDDKMTINRQRHWGYKDGQYQHIEEGNDK